MNISKNIFFQKDIFLENLWKWFLIIIFLTSGIQIEGQSIYYQSGIKHLTFGTMGGVEGRKSLVDNYRQIF